MKRILTVLLTLVLLAACGATPNTGEMSNSTASTSVPSMTAAQSTAMIVSATSAPTTSTTTAPTRPSITSQTTTQAPANIATVITPLCSLYNKPRTNSTLDTQALYNQTVTVLGKSGAFLQVRVVDGYTGYIEAKNVVYGAQGQGGKVRVYVTVPQANLVAEGKTFSVPMCTELTGQFLGDTQFEAQLPQGGTGQIDKAHVKVMPKSGKPALDGGAQIVATARLFMGTPYLWGGMGADGIDCSGLTYICYRLNGITLPRDGTPQSKAGKKIALRDIAIGDLVFFSHNTDKVGVSHTGIYLGDGQFIHSSVVNNGVGINRLDEPYYTARLVSVNRYW